MKWMLHIPGQRSRALNSGETPPESAWLRPDSAGVELIPELLAHSIEKAKAKPGTHARGIAADIKINNGNEAYQIIKNAQEMGFNGIGVAKTFIHVDTMDSMPVIWSY